MEKLQNFYNECNKTVEYKSIINIMHWERLFHPNYIKGELIKEVSVKGEVKRKIPYKIWKMKNLYNITPEFVDMVKNDILPYYT